MAPKSEQLRHDLDELRRENGRLRGMEAELAAALESLRSTERRLQLAVDAAQIGLWEWDIVSDRVSWDTKKHDVFGLTQGSFGGTKDAFFALVHPDDHQMLGEAIARAVVDGAPYQNEFRIVTPTGHTRWIANLGQVSRDDEGRPLRMIGVVYDVTERKLTDYALRESEEKFRSIVETNSEWIWATDRDGRLTYSNPAVQHILGYRPDEVAGHPIRSLLHEDDRAKADQILSIALAEKRRWDTFMVRCRHKDNTYRHLECHGMPVLDATGEVVGFRGSDRDVTDRMRAEEELRDARKMEGIGRLAAGFAHHFNNLLAVIVGHAEMAGEQTGNDGRAGDLQAIRRAAERGVLLTRQLLIFAGRQMVVPEVVNLNDQIEGMTTTLQRLIGDDSELVLDLSPGLWPVAADLALLDQVLMNLAVNAEEAMRTGGRLTIATANVAVDDALACRGAEVVPGDYVVIAVTDTGAGMTDEIAQQIFEPFFTTKERGAEGTGLGLSTAYGVVAQQGGHIRVQSQPGSGTTFRVYLPRHPASAGRATPIDAPSGRLSERLTILVADDDAGARKLAARALRSTGCLVLEAADGAEALVVAHAWHGRIHLLLTDVVMPGMSGRALAKRLQAERPDLETLYVSGFAMSALVQQQELDRDVKFLRKPFTARTLVARVCELLEHVES